VSQYTKEQIEKLCKKYGINITQCFVDLECINDQLKSHPKIKNKEALTKLMNSTEELKKAQGILDYETNN
jgi:mevalonate kinase